MRSTKTPRAAGTAGAVAHQPTHPLTGRRRRMSKTSLAPQTVPLEALTITWEENRSPFTAEMLAHSIGGPELARVLSWLSREIPTGCWKMFRDDREDLCEQVLQLAETCRALEYTDFGAVIIDLRAIFGSLARQLSDLGNRMCDGDIRNASVSVIGARQLDGLGETGGA
jgi:hypothetical protein